MRDIFISYSRDDQTEARTLAEALEAAGWSVWWDQHLRAGEQYDDIIKRAYNFLPSYYEYIVQFKRS